MPDYQNGKIYTMRSLSDKDLVYVGSSCQKLCARWTDHKTRRKQTRYHHISLYKTMNDKGIDDFYIELYEESPCENKEQLTKREGEVIRETGTLNQVVAGRSAKEYFQDNKEKIKEKARQYYKDNNDEIWKKKKSIKIMLQNLIMKRTKKYCYKHEKKKNYL